MLYESKRRPWSAVDLFEAVELGTIALNYDERMALEPFLWKDLYTEYDAEHLCTLLRESGAAFSEEFSCFLDAWRKDEYNHYLGFQRIYSLFFGEDETSIASRLAERRPDFSLIEDFLESEFNLCLLLAYDELATTRAYRVDYPFYRSLGPAQFNDWIRLVTGDEARHYNNSLRVAQVRYADRLTEAAGILERILKFDLSAHDYTATFVLDHWGEPFSPAMLKGCVKTVLEKLSSGAPSVAQPPAR